MFNRQERLRPSEKKRWYDNCGGGDCGDCGGGDCGGGDCGGADCDCAPCDLNLTLLGLIASAAPGRAPRPRATVPGMVAMAAIRGYQRWLSPRLRVRCRHVPNCSAYGMEAVRRYGLVVGSRLTAARIRRCNPGTPRGTSDPVP
jgi:putative membrane protein insertion efficiency factor